MALALGAFALVEVLTSGPAADLGDGHDVQGAVELSITGLRPSVPLTSPDEASSGATPQ